MKGVQSDLQEIEIEHPDDYKERRPSMQPGKSEKMDRRQNIPR